MIENLKCYTYLNTHANLKANTKSAEKVPNYVVANK